MFGALAVVRRSGEVGSWFVLDRDECIIGNGKLCDIRVQLPTVSTQHCRITVQPDGQAIISSLTRVDVSSVEGVSLPPNGEQVALSDGAELTVGSRSFRWHCQLPSSSPGLVDGEKRAARQRAVSFGVHLTPELFHCSLPPATPVRKGRQPGNTPIRKGRQPGSTPVSKDSSSDSSDQAQLENDGGVLLKSALKRGLHRRGEAVEADVRARGSLSGSLCKSTTLKARSRVARRSLEVATTLQRIVAGSRRKTTGSVMLSSSAAGRRGAPNRRSVKHRDIPSTPPASDVKLRRSIKHSDISSTPPSSDVKPRRSIKHSDIPSTQPSSDVKPRRSTGSSPQPTVPTFANGGRVSRLSNSSPKQSDSDSPNSPKTSIKRPDDTHQPKQYSPSPISAGARMSTVGRAKTMSKSTSKVISAKSGLRLGKRSSRRSLQIIPKTHKRSRESVRSASDAAQHMSEQRTDVSYSDLTKPNTPSGHLGTTSATTNSTPSSTTPGIAPTPPLKRNVFTPNVSPVRTITPSVTPARSTTPSVTPVRSTTSVTPSRSTTPEVIPARSTTSSVTPARRIISTPRGSTRHDRSTKKTLKSSSKVRVIGYGMKRRPTYAEKLKQSLRPGEPKISRATAKTPLKPLIKRKLLKQYIPQTTYCGVLIGPPNTGHVDSPPTWILQKGRKAVVSSHASPSLRFKSTSLASEFPERLKLSAVVHPSVKKSPDKSSSGANNDSSDAAKLKKSSTNVIVQDSSIGGSSDDQIQDATLGTSKVQQSPKNDHTSVSGVKKRMRTQKVQKSPKNNYCNVSGVKRLMKTPKVQKSPKNDYSNVSGVKRLMKTPKVQKSPKNDYSDVSGVKRLMKTPKVQKSPKNDYSDVSGVKRLMKTPKVQKSPKNDYSDVSGVKRLMKTPKVQKSPKNDYSNVSGVKRLMKTPKVQKSPKNDYSNVSGVKKLMMTPKIQKSPKNDYSNVSGVKKLMRTPKVQKSPKNDYSNVSGVKKLMRTPKVQKSPMNDYSNISGVKKLMRTPKVQKSPKNDYSNISGVKKLMRTPKVQKSPKNDYSNVSGVKKLMRTPKVQKSPKNDYSNISGVKKLMRTPKVQKSPNNDYTNLSGVKGLLESAKPKNVSPLDYNDECAGNEKVMTNIGGGTFFRDECLSPSEFSIKSGIEQLFNSPLHPPSELWSAHVTQSEYDNNSNVLVSKSHNDESGSMNNNEHTNLSNISGSKGRSLRSRGGSVALRSRKRRSIGTSPQANSRSKYARIELAVSNYQEIPSKDSVQLSTKSKPNKPAEVFFGKNHKGDDIEVSTNESTRVTRRGRTANTGDRSDGVCVGKSGKSRVALSNIEKSSDESVGRSRRGRFSNTHSEYGATNKVDKKGNSVLCIEESESACSTRITRRGRSVNKEGCSDLSSSGKVRTKKITSSLRKEAEKIVKRSARTLRGGRSAVTEGETLINSVMNDKGVASSVEESTIAALKSKTKRNRGSSTNMDSSDFPSNRSPRSRNVTSKEAVVEPIGDKHTRKSRRGRPDRTADNSGGICRYREDVSHDEKTLNIVDQTTRTSRVTRSVNTVENTGSVSVKKPSVKKNCHQIEENVQTIRASRSRSVSTDCKASVSNKADRRKNAAKKKDHIEQIVEESVSVSKGRSAKVVPTDGKTRSTRSSQKSDVSVSEKVKLRSERTNSGKRVNFDEAVDELTSKSNSVRDFPSSRSRKMKRSANERRDGVVDGSDVDLPKKRKGRVISAVSLAAVKSPKSGQTTSRRSSRVKGSQSSSVASQSGRRRR